MQAYEAPTTPQTTFPDYRSYAEQQCRMDYAQDQHHHARTAPVVPIYYAVFQGEHGTVTRINTAYWFTNDKGARTLLHIDEVATMEIFGEVTLVAEQQRIDTQRKSREA